MRRSSLAWITLVLCIVTAFSISCEEPSDTVPRWEPPKLAVGLMAARESEEPLRFEDDGIEYEIEEFVVVVSAVELHLCEVAANFWISPAYAHVPSSATRLGTPVVDDVMRTGGFARIFGEIAPPSGRYCEVWVVITPADDDVVNLTNVGLEDVFEKSAVAVGRWREGAGEWQEKTWTTSLRALQKIETDFRLKDGEQEQLILTKEMQDAALAAPVEGVEADDIAARFLLNTAELYSIYEAQIP